MSTKLPNPSGSQGDRANLIPGDRNGRDFSPPLENQKIKNKTIVSFLATAANEQVVFPPTDITSPSPPPALVHPNQTGGDDDDTVAGSNTSPFNVNISSRSHKEIVVKLEFMFTSDQHPTAVALRARLILHQMLSQFYNRLTIYNNQGRPVKDFAFTEEQLLQEFKLHHKFFGKSTKKYRYSLIFRIESTVPLSTIRQHPEVSQELRKHSANLVIHPWTEDVTDTVSLGWFLGPLPKYATADEMTIKMTDQIAYRAKVSAKNIPKFRCQMDNISITDKTNRRFTCRAYSLTAQRQHSAALQKIISTAYQQSTATDLFIFHRQRYSSPDSFTKAIRKQNEIESSKRVVAVKGLHPGHMFHFSEVLRANYSEIDDILATNKTFDLNPGGKPTGRYNILCAKDNFVTLAKRLSVELPTLYHDFMTQKGIEISALDEEVEVVSKFPGKFGHRSDDEFSGTTIQSRDSYISNCVSLLEAIEFADDTDDELSSSPNPAPTHQNHRATTNQDSPPPPGTEASPSAPPNPTYASMATARVTQTAGQPNPLQQQQLVIDSLKSELTELKNVIGGRYQAQVDARLANLEASMAEIANALRLLLSGQDSSTIGPATTSPQRKKTKTSSREGGSSTPMDDDSEHDLNHETEW